MTSYMECPDCGRRVALRKNSGRPFAHHSAVNPPIEGAWENCPGPTEKQKKEAARFRQKYGRGW